MYKYYSIPDLKTLESIIGKKPSLKFTSAHLLNDPFELKFNLTLDPFAVGQQEAFLKQNSQRTLADFKDWQEQVKDNDNYRWYEEQKQRAILSHYISLCSFTESAENNLMWSHYTSNHRGICVEYKDELLDELTKRKKYFSHGRIKYSESPPSVDYLDDIESKIKKMIFYKQSEWKYEKELRVILNSENETDYLPISPKYIKAVYIGSRAESIHGATVKHCKGNKYDCYEGITIGNTYNVQFKRHKEGTFYMRTFWG